MEGLVVGIDLCDAYTQVNCADERKTWTIPTVICRSKSADEWYVGKEAYAHNLQGDGVIVDKLVKLAKKDGTATICDVRYPARELLTRFLEHVLRLPADEYGKKPILQLVIAVPKLEAGLIRLLKECAGQLGFEDQQVHIISHPESFTYYILSQKKDIWNGVVGMFELSDERLRYYEMKVQRGMKKTIVLTEYEDMEEGFSLEILSTSSGCRLADMILSSCAERMMQKKSYSSVFLMGKGFEKREWAEEFMKRISSSRRIYLEDALFAKGAAYKALDHLQEKTQYPYTYICEGRLKSTVSMNVIHKGQETSVVLAAAGDQWYERVAALDVIPDNQKSVDFVVTPLDAKKRKLVSIPLEGFPERPERTTRVHIQVKFLDERTMDVHVKDQGFGDLFPSSGVQLRQEVML
ncbi:MAG: hypothetical protein HFG64_06965 [Lachnospiraceae bacterium]|nr:hypothetical protein [Lachnospiraceae bacterium]